MNGQIRIFLVCTLVGVLCGVLYDAFFLVRSTYRKHWLRILCDILFSIGFALVYAIVSVSLEFPPLRFFFLLGCGLGLLLYIKSFHKIVAFFVEKIYNIHTRKHKGKTEHGRRKRTKAS